MRRLVIFSFIISALATSAPVRAQELPPFAMPQMITAQDVQNLAVDFDEAFNTIQNPYLSDTIKLQYQISLLEKLVSRQSALEKIEDSYSSMGLPFKAPPPPRGICEQLPANGPCLAAYPDIYSELVAARKAYYKQLEVKVKDSQPGRKRGESDDEMVARQRKEAEEKARKAEEIARKTRYQWAELTCLSGTCRGVLVHSTNKDIRYTVHQGTRLPDGTVVESIRPGNVTVSMDGEIIKIRPAPGDDAGAAESAAINPLAQALTSGGLDTSKLPSTGDSRAAAASVIANAGGAPSGEIGTPITTPPAPIPAQGAATPPPQAPASNGPAAGVAPAPADTAPLGPSGLF